MFSHIITNFLGLSMLKIQLKAKGIVIMCMFQKRRKSSVASTISYVIKNLVQRFDKNLIQLVIINPVSMISLICQNMQETFSIDLINERASIPVCSAQKVSGIGSGLMKQKTLTERTQKHISRLIALRAVWIILCMFLCSFLLLPLYKKLLLIGNTFLGIKYVHAYLDNPDKMQKTVRYKTVSRY